MGPIRNCKTIEKSSKTKKLKKSYQNWKPHAKLSKPIHFHTPVIKNPDRSDTIVISGAYKVNYTNFITGFMNAMDLAFISSSI